MINTFEYFNLILTEIPKHMDDKDLRFIDDFLAVYACQMPLPTSSQDSLLSGWLNLG